MHIFSPLHNDREKFQILLCPLKLLNQKREIKKERDLKKMELENIIITSKQPEYKENETLNFLLIFVCYVHDFVPSMVRLSNGIGMHFKQNRGEKIVVHFCQDYISYTFNGYKHTLTHYPKIKYVYHLMSLMTYIPWIRVVVKKCYDIVVPSLTEMTLKKLKFIPGRTESTMRRMLDPPFTTCKYFLHYGSAMHSANYVEKFISYVKENNHTNVYQMLNKEYLNKDDRRTIYMHDFFMHGMYSEQYNRFILTYLLVMEAVLEPRHKWTLLDGNTYYCHIEAYHIYIWRCTWRQSIWMQIFMDQEINDAMIHPKGPNSSCRRMLVNDHHHMSEYLRDFDSY